MVMSILRTIGSYIGSSRIDMCWIESELYGPSTVKQIIDGKHVKRAKHDHLTGFIFLIPGSISRRLS